jgi:hypothetical protein
LNGIGSDATTRCRIQRIHIDTARTTNFYLFGFAVIWIPEKAVNWVKERSSLICEVGSSAFFKKEK